MFFDKQKMRFITAET